MPQNPFMMFQQYEEKPPRNVVDLSNRNNASFGLGTLYPVFCAEVNAGESFTIESAFGLKFMPMPFPVQTPLKATLHWYYVRNRTIWKDFPDFIYGNKSPNDVPHPYIARPATDVDFWKTGGISDYLGVPTQIFLDNMVSQVSVPLAGLSNVDSSFVLTSNSGQNVTNVNTSVPSQLISYTRNFHGIGITYDAASTPVPSLRSIINYDPLLFSNAGALDWFGFMSGPIVTPFALDENYDYVFSFLGSLLLPSLTNLQTYVWFFVKNKAADYLDMTCIHPDTMISCHDALTNSTQGDNNFTITVEAEGFVFQAMERVNDALSNDPELECYVFFGVQPSQNKSFVIGDPSSQTSFNQPQPGISMSFNVVSAGTADIGHYPSANPYAGQTPALPLSALPYRCYEAIYNAFYRNERLEPLMINGVAEYNKYCPNMDSGADDFPYQLYKRNWESDFLTSALPSPQQGIAPVVGVTGLSNLQIQDPDSNDIFTFQATVSGDGETITGGSFHNPHAPLAVTRTAQDIVTAGFTINDFRNVNALQRWVENNIRRGLKYRDQVMANTGVKPRFDELDMPEFIGGFSRPVQVSSITQTAPGGDAGVGDYAGQASCFGQSNHKITHYCDEAGFIMGILCITPTPVYSQLLPKHFIKRSPLDYHHPVFNHIGMQPITYDQVCPLQVFVNNPTQNPNAGLTFNDVFGYQRPYYDLLARTDEVHGLLRSTLRNYVMNRTFSEVPQLGASFIHVDPEQLNDVFTITKDQDVVVGELLFRCYAKRPVSLFGQPKIV